MKYLALSTLALGLASASPIAKREVPQEHSHDIFLDIVREFLNLNNPKGIQDPVFGLLGNAAASQGAGTVTNFDCLKQETADQAFTNAKAIGDVRGMAGALVYQALERNTGRVGLESVLCTETPVNPEIGLLTQHQDPAATGAGAINKGITLVLAQQLALIGVDPLLALESGTFEPGDLNDATGRGNSCDTLNDLPGCIFTQRLLVLDATPEEIAAAVAGIVPTFTGTGVISATDIDFAGLAVAPVTEDVAGFVTIATAPNPAEATATATATLPPECFVTPSPVCTVITTTVAATATSEVLASMSVAPSAVQTGAPAAGVNVQAFTGALGAPAVAVIFTEGAARPFEVAGDTFLNIGAAIQRSCDRQKNACANAVNSGQLAGTSVGDCDAQAAQCRSANNLKVKAKRAEAQLAKRAEIFAARHAEMQLAKRAASFGSCSNPTIKFAAGLDGRKEEAFIPNNLKDFGHGSAQKIGIIASFICQRLSDSCKAPADVVASCASASAAAVATTQNQAAADAFNNLLAGVAAAAPAPVITAAPPVPTKDTGLVVMTITSCF